VTKVLPNVYALADYGARFNKFALTGDPGKPGRGSPEPHSVSLAVKSCILTDKHASNSLAHQ
jgi:hypothetical protein